ncbi:MAG: ADP-ribosylglycohydrolase family protein [Candidatus Neomarinimicrobiota bacterium]|jgi:ADP-ribosylglycohydrolase|nr:ADP-ribosylglycohydrolase family protein [Candidatus Neomarinimicrobiota bacterium]MDD3966046.1 ADP-ribosylglycohydrolase family protein [Candidatus Neomarinimicrobiota bacterium]MDX9780470.1 ADP-ribosylglycohydrolase family protein [bacterium]
MHKLKNKIKGCLLGVAAGDALGMPSSMMGPDEIERRFGEIRQFLPAPEDHLLHRGMVAGEITDDTQQTLAIADSIIEEGRVDARSIAQHLIRWGEEYGIFNTNIAGPSTLRALNMIRNGRSPEESGNVGDTNGACMRIAAVGIYGYGDLQRTLDSVEKACKATHNTNIAIAGASAVAIVIGKALQGEKDIDVLIASALEAAALGMLRGNIWYGASIEKRIRLAMEIVEKAPDRKSAMRDIYDYVGAGVQISETVPTCLAVLKMANGDPLETIRIAANLGGDCDTIAAISGSMAGALGGAKLFPDSWIRTLENVNNINFDHYCDQLYKIITEE